LRRETRHSLDDLPVVIRQSAPGAAKLVFGCLAFVALSVWLLASGSSPPWVGWLGIAFFGLGPAVFLITWLRPATLTIAADGVTLRFLFRSLHLDWPQMRIAWSMAAHPPEVRRFLLNLQGMAGQWELPDPAVSELLTAAIERFARR
jgi:hypothetical protein